MVFCARKRSPYCSDHIIHAGDIGDPEILTQLEVIAPVTAVRGNIDKQAWARNLPATDVLELELDLKPEAAGFSAIISGHSHAPHQEMKTGVLYFNPGSAGPRRFRLPVSVGRLVVRAGKIAAEIVDLTE